MMTLQNFIFVKTFNDNLPKRCAVEGEATRFHYFATPLYFWSKFCRSFPSDTKDIWHIPGKGLFHVFGMKSGPRKILPFWKRKSYWPKFPNHWWVRCDWSINFISVPFYILTNSICSRYAHLESRHHETLFDGFIQKMKTDARSNWPYLAPFFRWGALFILQSTILSKKISADFESRSSRARNPF